ncbi:MAG: hypothetical protein DRP15_02265, partial [Candidatus Aenigmatarchaeota archaeon]
MIDEWLNEQNKEKRKDIKNQLSDAHIKIQKLLNIISRLRLDITTPLGTVLIKEQQLQAIKTLVNDLKSIEEPTEQQKENYKEIIEDTFKTVSEMISEQEKQKLEEEEQEIIREADKRLEELFAREEKPKEVLKAKPVTLPTVRAITESDLENVVLEEDIKKELNPKEFVEVDESDLLGEGEGGRVYKVFFNNKVVVAKVFDVLNPFSRIQLSNELVAYNKLPEDVKKYFPEFYGSVLVESKTEGKVYPGLLIDYLEAEDLEDLISGEELTDVEKVDLLLKLSQIIKDLHDNGMAHLDLRFKNVLVLKETNELKLIDLGTAKFKDVNKYDFNFASIHDILLFVDNLKNLIKSSTEKAIKKKTRDILNIVLGDIEKNKLYLLMKPSVMDNLIESLEDVLSYVEIQEDPLRVRLKDLKQEMLKELAKQDLKSSEEFSVLEKFLRANGFLFQGEVLTKISSDEKVRAGERYYLLTEEVKVVAVASDNFAVVYDPKAGELKRVLIEDLTLSPQKEKFGLEKKLKGKPLDASFFEEKNRQSIEETEEGRRVERRNLDLILFDELTHEEELGVAGEVLEMYKQMLSWDKIRENPENIEKLNNLFEKLYGLLIRQDEDDLQQIFNPHDAWHSILVLKYVKNLIEVTGLETTLDKFYGKGKGRMLALFTAALHDVGYPGLTEIKKLQKQIKEGKDKGEDISELEKKLEKYGVGPDTKIKKGFHAELSANLVDKELKPLIVDLFDLGEKQYEDFFNAIKYHGADKEKVKEDMERGSGRYKYTPASDTDNPLLMLVRAADNIDMSFKRLKSWQQNPAFLWFLRKMWNFKPNQEIVSKLEDTFKRYKLIEELNELIEEGKWNEVKSVVEKNQKVFEQISEKIKLKVEKEDKTVLNDLKKELGTLKKALDDLEDKLIDNKKLIEQERKKELEKIKERVRLVRENDFSWLEDFPGISDEERQRLKKGYEDLAKHPKIVDSLFAPMTHIDFMHFYGAVAVEDISMNVDEEGKLVLNVILNSEAKNVGDFVSTYQVQRTKKALASLKFNGKPLKINIKLKKVPIKEIGKESKFKTRVLVPNPLVETTLLSKEELRKEDPFDSLTEEEIISTKTKTITINLKKAADTAAEDNYGCSDCKKVVEEFKEHLKESPEAALEFLNDHFKKGTSFSAKCLNNILKALAEVDLAAENDANPQNTEKENVLGLLIEAQYNVYKALADEWLNVQSERKRNKIKLKLLTAQTELLKQITRILELRNEKATPLTKVLIEEQNLLTITNLISSLTTTNPTAEQIKTARETIEKNINTISK